MNEDFLNGNFRFKLASFVMRHLGIIDPVSEIATEGSSQT